MADKTHKKQSLKDFVTSFTLAITLAMGTAKGRRAVDRTIKGIDQMNCGIRIAFKIFLFVAVIAFLFFLKNWLIYK